MYKMIRRHFRGTWKSGGTVPPPTKNAASDETNPENLEINHIPILFRGSTAHPPLSVRQCFQYPTIKKILGQKNAAVIDL